MTSADDAEPVGDLGPPYTYCDRVCERCAIADTCQVWQAAQAREREHERRGEDPNDMRVVLSDLEAMLRSSIEIAERAARERGIDVDAPIEPPPRNHLGERLCSESMDLSKALRDLLESPAGCRAAQRPAGEVAVEEIVRAAFLIPAKVARLASYLREDGGRAFDPQMVGSAAANLALLEQVEGALGGALAVLGVRGGQPIRALLRAHARLWRLLAPLQSTLPAEPRAALDALITQGRAPSPFCVRAQGGGASTTLRRSEPDPLAPHTSASTVTPPAARSSLE